MNDVLDGKIGKDRKNKEKAKEVSDPAAPSAAWTCEQCGKTGNTGKFLDDGYSRYGWTVQKPNGGDDITGEKLLSLDETGKADLEPESMVEINRIAKLMQENPGIEFEVQGIAESRLTPVGKGSHEPIASNSTDEGRAKNRRVEFVKK